MIPYSTQWIDEEDIDAVVGVLRSDRLTQGPLVEKFERAVAAYTGVKFAIAFSSGTAALHAACVSAGVGQGDELITSPITFVASANCAVYVGAKPVFADIDDQTLTLDCHSVEAKITSKTKVLMPVDFAGRPAHLDEINGLAKKRGLIVIEDAAHSLGAKYKGRRVGGLADMTTLSFHPVKHITTGEGGMVLTNSVHFRDKLVLFRSHGITRELTKLKHEKEGEWYYEMQELGYNYRITDIQCALGLSQLRRIDSFVKRRREIACRYAEAFELIPGLALPREPVDVRSSYHLYVLQLPIEQLRGGRRAVFDALLTRKIGVNVHYIPVHLQPYYQQQYGYRPGDFPVAERYYQRAISVPIYPRMTDEDVTYVTSSVIDVLQELAI